MLDHNDKISTWGSTETEPEWYLMEAQVYHSEAVQVTRQHMSTILLAKSEDCREVCEKGTTM